MNMRKGKTDKNQTYLAETGAKLLITGAILGTKQGLVVMVFGGIAFIAAILLSLRPG